MDTKPEKPFRILVLCTHNSARSQMAEALLRRAGGGAVEVESAGTDVTRVHPLAAATMAARGLDLSTHRSKSVAEFAGQSFDLVLTVCDGANESCPVFPGSPRRLHWSLPDPSRATGAEDDQRAAFERVADELEARIRTLELGR